jgi:hypothetical protein
MKVTERFVIPQLHHQSIHSFAAQTAGDLEQIVKAVIRANGKSWFTTAAHNGCSRFLS